MFLLQVETIGDAYMVVGGLPTPCDNHAEKVAHMGCSMMEAGQKVLSPVDGLPIKVCTYVGNQFPTLGTKVGQSPSHSSQGFWGRYPLNL